MHVDGDRLCMWNIEYNGCQADDDLMIMIDDDSGD